MQLLYVNCRMSKYPCWDIMDDTQMLSVIKVNNIFVHIAKIQLKIETPTLPFLPELLPNLPSMFPTSSFSPDINQRN